MSFIQTPARRGLDALLARYPHFDLLSLDWQIEGWESDYAKAIGARTKGPWLLVVLGQPSETSTLDPMHGMAWARWEFAIWKSTGAVHSMRDGEVSDDPIIEVS